MTPGEASAKGAILIVDGMPAAHAFDIEGGVAWIAHGWADADPGEGQPCHIASGTFDVYDKDTWIALDGHDLIIRRHPGPERPDGARATAKAILELDLRVTIPGN